MKDILREKIIQSDEIDNSILSFFETKKDRYLYGNGEQTAIALYICRMFDVEIRGIILPPGSDFTCVGGRWGQLIKHIRTYSIGEIEFPENVFVMMACGREKYKDVEGILNGFGYTDVIGCLWLHNSTMIEIGMEIR